MNFKNGDGVSFFKILLNDSVDYLRLPTDFAEKHLEKGNNKKQTLVLKPKSGVKWSVKYFKIENRYYLMDGWLKFVKDNRLQVDDFLVFWLLPASPKSIFQVFLYAPNGCLKHPVSSSGAGNGKKRFVREETSEDDNSQDDEEDDGDGDDDSLQKVHKLLRKVLKKSFHHQLPMTLCFWKANGLDGYDFVRLSTDLEGKIWKVEVRKYGGRKYPFLIKLQKGWCHFWNDNKLKMGDILKITHVKDNLLHVDVIKGQKGKTIKKKRMN